MRIKDLLKIRNIDKKSYYYRYIHQAHLFEVIGIVFLMIGIILNELTKNGWSLPLLLCVGIGIISLIIGGASSQPHVVIKSFASLLRNDPTTKNAKEFIKAFEYVGNIGLVSTSRTLIDASIAAYANSLEKDEKVLEELKAVAKNHIKTRFF